MLVGLFLAAGCASLGIGDKAAHDKQPAGEVVRLAAYWVPAIGYANGRVVDGFAGKVLLFGSEGFSPIRARGRIVIYAFHDTKGGPYSAKPDRRWEFSPDKLPAHLEETMFGPTYAFWVPWPREADAKGAVSLQVAFVPEGEAEATPVVSPAVRIALPELQSASAHPASAASNSAREVDSRQSNVQTQTIPLGARPGSALPVVEEVGIRRDDRPNGSERLDESARGDSGEDPLAHSPTRSLATGAGNRQFIADNRHARFQPSDRFRQQPFMVGRYLPFENYRRPFLPDDDTRAAENARITQLRRQPLKRRGGSSAGDDEADAKTGTK